MKENKTNINNRNKTSLIVAENEENVWYYHNIQQKGDAWHKYLRKTFFAGISFGNKQSK